MGRTKNQQLAIDVRDCNVLVSAAAGSGKTSVLVDRIISRITDPNNPVDVDRLLVMTFTNAAATEMRNRIRDAIDERLAAGSDENLARQSLLVHHAMITTIHGFCKSVVTDHFEEAGLDPNFRVADENECKLIRQDALDECLEEAYEAADPAFLNAVECYSAGKSDAALSGLVISLYNYLWAAPDPEGLAKDSCNAYRFDSFEEFTKSALAKAFDDLLLAKVEELGTLAAQAENIIDQTPDVEPYRAAIEAYSDTFSRITDKCADGACIYDTVRAHLLAMDIPRFGSIRGKNLPDDVIAAKDAVTSLRDRMRKKAASLSLLLPCDYKSAFEHQNLAGPMIRALIDLTLRFGEIYAAKKHDVNVIDFNDMEHMAAKILSNPDIAAIYRDHFIEIYVDEYQDSNMTQEHLVELICRHDPGNVFQVGDVKQSIYRFRHARPDLFLSKYNSYLQDEGAADRLILLNDNFRSRREVTDAVNEVFSAVMTADTGGIEYDERARLNCGATYYETDSPCEGDSYRTEIVIGSSDDLSSEEVSANVIACRILSMVREGFLIYDAAAKITRQVSFGDFAILVRTTKKYESVFRDVFTEAGIPLAVTGSEGYFGTIEVKTTLAFLSAVDNPLCDIPLAAVMRSPVGGFSDAEMAQLTVDSGSDRCLYDRVKAAGSEKCKRILSLLQKYREMSAYMPVHALISDFIDDHYGIYVKCMANAPRRMANLAMLVSKAEDYGRTSFKGLYQFVRYMDQIRKYEIDDGEASVSSENDDVVRLMTIHASKGLEFPVCFVAGIDKNRNARDESETVIRSVKYGIGTRYTDLDARITGNTISHIMAAEDNRIESIAEEMRVLYVAMTRAKEKLILVASAGENCFDSYKGTPGDYISFLDMLQYAYSENGLKHTDISYVTDKDLVAARFDGMMDMESAADDLISVLRKDDHPETVPECMKYALLPYPYPIDGSLRAKLSVSDLKHMAIEEQIRQGLSLAPEGEQLFAETEPDKYIPTFMRAEGTTATGATFYGTAFHRIMELWEYSSNEQVTEEAVTDFAAKMYEKRRMEKAQIEAVNAKDVATFLNSALGGRMQRAKAAGRLFREQPFVIGMEQSGETVLVQGIIDAYFIEDDGITIVDYKTDRVSDAEMLVNRYRAQLEYYGKALSQITGQNVKDLIIWSTKLAKQINIA